MKQALGLSLVGISICMGAIYGIVIHRIETVEFVIAKQTKAIVNNHKALRLMLIRGEEEDGERIKRVFGVQSTPGSRVTEVKKNSPASVRVE